MVEGLIDAGEGSPVPRCHQLGAGLTRRSQRNAGAEKQKATAWVALGILEGVVPREVGPQFCFYGNTPHLYDEVDCNLKALSAATFFTNSMRLRAPQRLQRLGLLRGVCHLFKSSKCTALFSSSNIHVLHLGQSTTPEALEVGEISSAPSGVMACHPNSFDSESPSSLRVQR